MRPGMTFCTAINCMDGRVQLPVMDYLKRRFKIDFVDEISEAGPVHYLAEEPDSFETRSIFRRLEVSLHKHGSKVIGVAAHWDCAGNPVDEAKQRKQLQAAMKLLREKYPDTEVLGLWVDREWKVTQVSYPGA